MADKVVIPVELQTRLTGMKDAISELQKELKSDKFNIKLDNTAGKRLKGLFGAFEEEYKDFKSKIADGSIDIADEKDLQRQGKKLITTYKKIMNEVGSSTISLDLAKKLFPDKFNKEVQEATQIVKNSLNGLAKNQKITPIMEQLKKELEQATAAKIKLEQTPTKEDFKQSIEKETAAIEKATEALRNYYEAREAQKTIEEVATSETANLRGQKTKTSNQLGRKGQQLTQILNSRDRNGQDIFSQEEREALNRNARGMISKWTTQRDNATIGLNNAKASGSKDRADKYKELLSTYQSKIDAGERYFEASKDYTELKEKFDSLSAQIDEAVAKRIEEIKQALFSGDTSTISDADGNIIKKLQGLYEQGQASRETRSEATKRLQAAEEGVKTAPTIKQRQGELTQRTKEIEELNNQIARLQTQITELDENKIKQALKNAGLEELADSFTLSEESLENLKKSLEEADQQKLTDLRGQIDSIIAGLDEGDEKANRFKDILQQLDDSADQTRQLAQEAANLSNQITQFFSISNGIQLFKNAIRDAYDTVKELDAAMTEMAVVTDFSVSDMWDMLPEYAAEANELGRATVDMYDATARYVQQGLEVNTALELGVETLKMAAVAGIDAASATEAMTSALRGFNLELNETQAQRVNDVYSELAA